MLYGQNFSGELELGTVPGSGSYGAWWIGERGGGWVRFYVGTEEGANEAVDARMERELDSVYSVRPIDNPPWEELRETTSKKG